MFATPKILTGLIVIFALGASSVSAQNCTASGIQTRLNSGTSVGTILSQCSNLQLSDFYGKTYAGGIITSLNADRSGRGTVAAPTNDNSNATWASMWIGLDYIPGTSSSAGAGRANTNYLCGIFTEDGSCTRSPKPTWGDGGPALYGPYFSVTSTQGGYPDWYLPSSGDLSQAYAAAPSAFTGCSAWWSSTQTDWTISGDKDLVANADQLQSNGQIGNQQKLTGACIRSFRDVGPWIESATPSTQEQGGTITLAGTNFDPVAANNTVMFDDDHQGVVTAATATQLTFTVPVGVSTGHVRLILNGVYSNSFPITITPAPEENPTVTGFSVPAVVKGDANPDAITLLGEYFGSLNTVVFAGGVSVQNVATSDPTRLNVTVPDGAKSGSVTVSAAGRHGDPSAVELVVLQYEVTDQGGGTKRYKAGAASTDGLHAVAVGYPGLLRVSADGGDSWASVSTWPAVGDSAAFGTVVFDTTGNSRNFIAWADYDFMSSFPMAVSSSNPANTWANRNSTNTRSVYAVDMAADSLFAYFGQAINVSDGGFIPPGVLRWTSELDYLTGEISGFTSSPSILVAVGATNKAWWRNRASGSKTWTQVATPVYQLNDVAYGNGVFAAVGNNSGAGTQMVYSQDGQTWSAATCNGSASSCVPLQTVTWNPQWGLFTAYGSLLTQYVSLDGRNWVTLPMPSQNGNGTPSEYIDAVNLGSSVLLMEAKGYIVRLSKLVPTH